MSENILESHIHTAAQPEFVDPQRFQMAVQQYRSEQSLMGGLFAGLVAAVGGAAAWALITVVTEYQIGWMAIGIGFLVGVAVRAAGRGMDKSFAFMGAFLALGGCLLGNLLAVSHFVAMEEGMGSVELFLSLNPLTALVLIALSFSPIDLLFYGLAVTQAYSLSAREVSDDELLALAQSPTQ